MPAPRIEWYLEGEFLRNDPDLAQHNIRATRLKSGTQFKYSFSRGTEAPHAEPKSEPSHDKEDDSEQKKDARKKITLTSNKLKETLEEQRTTLTSESSSSSNHSKKASASKQRLSVKGWLTIYDVSRALLMTRVQCKAVNSKTLPPVSTSATLDMNCEYYILGDIVKHIVEIVWISEGIVNI